ncbi:hypothetical protein [Sphingomonas sp. PR090111-T3T-6A]|uniref:hypothetical protein n=1 Tax=Sphingomonas sp. PR090111-T3T-6A TaxID=685778 RepID=UPI00035C7D7B|nr:hypothetical protein [Sphingomonas sp. PR090111-T3T-6A]
MKFVHTADWQLGNAFVRKRHALLVELEEKRDDATAVAATSVAAETLAILEANDRAVPANRLSLTETAA